MKRSTDRILTSHVGTLPRPANLEALLQGGEEKRQEYFAALPDAVKDAVRLQGEVGLDVINDGEHGKIGGFSNYVRTRLAGYELKPLSTLVGREQKDFPQYAIGRVGGPRAEGAPPQMQMVCTGPISYIGVGEIERDIRNMKAAMQGQEVTDVFMAAVGPENVNYQPGGNEYYATTKEYVEANAEALKQEYKAIADAGFVLQIDMPVMKYNALSLSLEEFRARFAEMVELINHALSGIPADQVRVHVCYGGMKIPHTGDLMLGQYLDLLLKINANGISTTRTFATSRSGSCSARPSCQTASCSCLASWRISQSQSSTRS